MMLIGCLIFIPFGTCPWYVHIKVLFHKHISEDATVKYHNDFDCFLPSPIYRVIYTPANANVGQAGILQITAPLILV